MSEMESVETTNQTAPEASPSHPRAGGDPVNANDGASTTQENSLDSHLRGSDGEKPEVAQEAKSEKPDPLHIPAKSADDIKLKLPKEFTPDKEATANFQKLCVESKLTPAQAQALVDWQLKSSAAAQERMIDAGQKALSNMWGGKYEEKRNQSLSFFTTLDRKMDGRLSASSAGRAMANSPDFIEAMHTLSEMIGEDALGGFDAGTATMKEVDKVEFYNNLFKQGK